MVTAKQYSNVGTPVGDPGRGREHGRRAFVSIFTGSAAAVPAAVSPVAATGDIKLWALYVSVVLLGAKIAAFAIQYVAFRFLVGNRLRATARA